MIEVAPRPRIYVAASFRRLDECRQVAQLLEGAGMRVTSRWLKDPEAGIARPELAAERDMADLRESDGLLSLTETPAVGYLMGGRHVEFGIALALRKWLWIVGPLENVFHHHPTVRAFADLTAFLVFMRQPAGWHPPMPWLRERRAVNGG